MERAIIQENLKFAHHEGFSQEMFGLSRIHFISIPGKALIP